MNDIVLIWKVTQKQVYDFLLRGRLSARIGSGNGALKEKHRLVSAAYWHMKEILSEDFGEVWKMTSLFCFIGKFIL